MRLSRLCIPTLGLLLAGPALAGDGEPEDSEDFRFEFIAVLDSNELPEEMVNALDLDVDGPVIIASAHISDAFEDIYLRYDAVKDRMGPLSRFNDLEMMADVFWDGPVPVVISDFIDVDDIADAVFEGMPSEQLRVVFDPAFMATELGARVPVDFGGDVVATVEANSPDGPQVPVIEFRSTNFVVPSVHAEDVYERSLPAPDEYAFYGFLCEGPDDGGPCVVAQDVSASADIYISLNADDEPTEQPTDGPDGPDGESTAPPAEQSTDTAPPAEPEEPEDAPLGEAPTDLRNNASKR